MPSDATVVLDLDAMLRLVRRRDASELRLAPHASPTLVLGAQSSRLGLPPYDPATLGAIARDVLGADRLAALGAGQDVRFAHRDADGYTFDVHVTGSLDAPSLCFRPQVDRTLMTIEPDALLAAPEDGLTAPDPLRRTLQIAEKLGASDLHLGDGDPPLARIGGDLKPLADVPVAGLAVRPLVETMLTAVGRRRLADGGAVDFSFTVPGTGRFRGNAYRAVKGHALAIRMLPERIPTLDDLRLPRSLSDLVNYPNGMVLFTGPTGSGKSATMAALVQQLNETRPVHIITLEDPIEFVHPRKRALIRQREVGVHVASFADGLRDSLREDPDVILVGEMRDQETIALALTAAETGHLVLSTLHANRAASTIDRIADVFPEHRQAQVRLQVAESLRAVVAQRLLPRRDGDGRVAALEVLRLNKAISNHIREKRIHQIPSVIQTHRDDGMWVLERHLAALVKREIVDESVARAHADEAEMFDTYLRTL
jgi:twitching motility protein PilT